jgi:CRP/FNR family transcriptional regulator, cyclic AMP receptor protein
VPTAAELLDEVPVLAGLAREHRARIAGCARNRPFAVGEHLMREGGAANACFVIRSGAVAIETHVPQRGPQIIETLHEGDLVGWSWLFEPYHAAFDARAVTALETIELDGACLRARLEEYPTLARDLLGLFAAVIVERLQATRMRLLDVYGPGPYS